LMTVRVVSGSTEASSVMNEIASSVVGYNR
jgi:hypothetical protein